MSEQIVAGLKEAREAARVEKPRGKIPSFSGVWNGMGRAPDDYQKWQGDTAVDEDQLGRVIDVYDRKPEGFNVHRKLQKLHDSRIKAVRSGKGIDWGTGEMLAIGALLLEGVSVRFTGQDVERGTFSHRHAVLHDTETGDRWRPLQHVGGGKRHENQGRFEIVNTMLSEEAVVGFEWGFASADPRNLVVWEAQFGDFVNGAQAVIDQIVAAAESKWGYMNGIVFNLPHGYEGQGPEHSNAYLERWLSLCAEMNMQVAVPTTPAQYFHLLRRQIHRPFRKPLVVMSPKSLLRKPEATSRLSELSTGKLELVLPDPEQPRTEGVRRVILCSGKVFYALDAARREKKSTRRRGRSGRAALPVPRARADGRGRAVSQGGRGRLVPGRACQPRGLVVRQAPASGHVPGPPHQLRGPRCKCQSGGRQRVGTRRGRGRVLIGRVAHQRFPGSIRAVRQDAADGVTVGNMLTQLQGPIADSGLSGPMHRHLR